MATIEDKATLRCDDYIVKSWGDDYPELSLNEYYCMKIIRNSKIFVPDFFISEDEKLFIMKRFDKIEDRYIGFEDMCVLMGKQRDDKYEGSYEQIAKVIKTFVSSKYKKSSLIDFFKMTYLNFQLQNGDAHLKNFGLIYYGIDDIRLAPTYDVVSTTAYIKNDIPALHLLGSKKWWNKKFLIKFGMQSCDLTQKEISLAIEDCDQAIVATKSELTLRQLKEINEDKKNLLEHLTKILDISIAENNF